MAVLANITRRDLLKRSPAAAAAIAVPASATASVALASSPRERMKYHIAEYQKAVQEIDPTIVDWTTNDDLAVTTECALVVIGYRKTPKHIEWSGPGRYEIQDGDRRPIYHIEREWSAMDPGFYSYRACHWWKGRREGRWRYFSADELKIIRKLT